MKNEKSHSGAGTPEQQTGKDTLQAYSIPLSNSTMESGRPQGFFEAILDKGAENGKTQDELRQLAGVSSTRLVRLAISREREQGAVILSGPTGFYLPADGEQGRQETAAFVAMLKAKGASTLRAARSAQAYLDHLPGQMELGGNSQT